MPYAQEPRSGPTLTLHHPLPNVRVTMVHEGDPSTKAARPREPWEGAPRISQAAGRRTAGPLLQAGSPGYAQGWNTPPKGPAGIRLSARPPPRAHLLRRRARYAEHVGGAGPGAKHAGRLWGRRQSGGALGGGAEAARPARRLWGRGSGGRDDGGGRLRGGGRRRAGRGPGCSAPAGSPQPVNGLGRLFGPPLFSTGETSVRAWVGRPLADFCRSSRPVLPPGPILSRREALCAGWRGLCPSSSQVIRTARSAKRRHTCQLSFPAAV
ncbi:unnamed protein product [Rangifer tarandus platyrhynchus]|uniref:Uncharacterized protein n=1 Tax=Rangifer tarandus platyrhynchus TaxID=3082113 RepID=A0ABN8Y6K2_RANTA|nr:unnamed protein product [Rangifer tarandus platyrhynchus]